MSFAKVVSRVKAEVIWPENALRTAERQYIYIFFKYASVEWIMFYLNTRSDSPLS
jgi:hypothetical protein